MTSQVETNLSSTPPRSLTSGRLPRFIDIWVALAAIAIGAIVFAGFGHVDYVAGWLVLGAALYLIAIGILASIIEGRRRATDRFVRGIVVVAFLLAIIPLVSTLWTVVQHGITTLTPQFIFNGEQTSFDRTTFKTTLVAGVWPAIVGTLIITGIAALISIPIGLLTAVWLTEYALPNNPVRRIVTFLVDVMTGIPSIVAGLFAFALFALIVGPGTFNGLSAAIALCVLMIPTMVRASEEMIKLVPMELREASYALGVSKWLTIVKVVLRTSVAGLVTGAMLAIARVIGETAPIYIAAGYTRTAFNADPLHGAMSTLAVVSFRNYVDPDPTQPAVTQAEAWGSALLLILIVVVLNLIARLIAARFAPKARR
ncbi:phosphate ABC transporter permease PstA [Pseudolysinimonas sp.]|uniref:phosphate ABC transporter permease PstA n=1 Tax=Pseudolysinimonas sp. TaxID=2680009 RepID=UPI003F7E6998